MRVLVLCPDTRPKNANENVNFFPVSPEFAGKFVDAFCEVMLIEEAHDIAFSRDFKNDETNIFIFNRINEHRRAMFRNNGADWVICLANLMGCDQDGRCMTVISQPMFINPDETRSALKKIAKELPGNWNLALFSDFASRFEDEIAFYRDENFRLKERIDNLNKELDRKEMGL